jgi:photosystem II stability/assembly factor-like uncharacterized protein
VEAELCYYRMITNFQLQKLLLLATIVLVITGNASSQWKNIAPNFLGNIHDHSQPNHPWYGGALSYADGVLWTGKYDLWKSIDTGKTWEHIPLRQQEANLHRTLGTINDIQFFDKNNGLVASDSEGGCVYLTQNGGLSWTTLHPPFKIPTATSAFFLGSSQIIVITSSTEILISRDGGITWENAFPTTKEVHDGKWVHDGIAYFLLLDPMKSSSIIYTTDFGVSWIRPEGIAEYDSYSIDFDKCDPNIIYLVSEEAINSMDQLSNIYVSSDLGSTWISKATGPTETSTASCYFVGSIVNLDGATFVPTRTDGVMRSTDKGSTWKGIGGPNITYDTRFITAINKNIILAVDTFGSIWATFNSGGDSLLFSSNSTYHFSSSKIINDSNGVIVHLPIYLHHGAAMSTVDMTMHYPSSPLQYLGGALVNGKSIDVPNSQWPGRAQLHFDGSDLNALTDSLVGYVNFKWSPLEFDCTFINFDSITPQFAGDCGARNSTPEPFKGIIGAYQWCGESSVTTHQESTLNFTVIPNPSHGIFTVSSNEYSGNATITLFDELGKVVIETKQIINPSGVQIDASKVSAGNYFLRIEISGGKKTYSMKII